MVYQLKEKKKRLKDDFVYDAEVIRVVDGDTYDLGIDLGFRLYHEDRFRLMEINTPETRGKERSEGLKVKEYVKNLIEGKMVVVKTFRKEKFGRYLCEIYLKAPKKKPLSKLLLRKKMAKKVDY